MKIGNYREFPGCPVVGTWHSLPGPRFNAWFGSKIPQCTRRQPKKKKKKKTQTLKNRQLYCCALKVMIER